MRIGDKLVRSSIFAIFGVTLLLAPQLSILQGLGDHAPTGLITGLLILAGIVFGSLYGAVLRRAHLHLGIDAKPRTGGWLTLAHLPLLLLWLPFARSGVGAGDRPHLLVVGVGAALIFAGMTVEVLRHGQKSLTRRWFGFLAGCGMAFLATKIFASFRGTDPAGAGAVFFWGLLLLVSFIGWGLLAHRLLLPDERTDPAFLGAFGLAVVVVLGGLLNLLWMISHTTITILLAVGVGAAGTALPGAWTWIRARRPFEVWKEKPALAMLVILAAAMAGLQLAASAAATVDTVSKQPAFDLHDDDQAYLVFPQKMLSLGSMGPEPFEARRMLSLGGQSFLQTLTLVALPTRALHLVDAGLAPLLLLGLVVGFGRRHEVDARLILFVSFLVLALPHATYRGNTSAVVSGIVMMFFCFRLVADENSPARSAFASAVPAALAAAALCSLKSTFIPMVAVFFGLTLLFRLTTTEEKRGVALEAVIGGLLTFLFCLPWMLSILQSSGTLLYPIFGKGYYGGVFTNGFADVAGDFSVSASGVARAVARHLMPLAPLLILAIFVREKSSRRPAFALAAAAAISVVLFVVFGDPEINRSLARYSFPVSTAAFLAFLLSAFVGSRGRRSAALPVVAGLAVALLFLLTSPDALLTSVDRLLVNAAEALDPGPLASKRERETARLIDEAMAGEGSALTSLDQPFLLDFSRRDIFIMSLPGMAGLPPGLPLEDGAEAVAEYLGSHGIRFLAYGGFGGHERLLDLSEDQIRARYPHSKMRWVMLRYHERYHRVVDDLADSRKTLFQDGETILLDLQSRMTAVRPATDPQRLVGFVDDVWTGPEASVLALRRQPGDEYLRIWTRGWRPDDDHSRPFPIVAAVGGEDLAEVARNRRSVTFRLPDGVPEVFDLGVRCPPLDLAALGAVGSNLPLGLDIDAVEISTSAEAPERPFAKRLQPVKGSLAPAHAWKNEGFYSDHGWTDGNATVDDLRWLVDDRQRLIRLVLHPHPQDDDIEELAPRLWVNGIELEFCGSSGVDLDFHLYDGLKEINRIRVVSSTFIPRDIKPNATDSRTLGIPIREITLITQE